MRSGLEFFSVRVAWNRMFSLLAFQRAIACLFIGKKEHNFMNHLNQVWWSWWDPTVTVTSTPPWAFTTSRCNIFLCQIWVLLITSFPTRHSASLCEQQNAQCHKAISPGVDALPTSPVVLLRPRCDVNPPQTLATSGYKEWFWCQVWVLLTISFPTRHRSPLYEQQNAQCHKTLFPGVDALPTSPVTSLPPLTFGWITCKKKFKLRF